MTAQGTLFEPGWHDLPLDPRATNPDAPIPTYRCPGCGKHPESGGSDHAWDGTTYLGTVNHNGCCGYRWRTEAKPSDWWSTHKRGEGQR